jgi:hypothetical protein
VVSREPEVMSFSLLELAFVLSSVADVVAARHLPRG